MSNRDTETYARLLGERSDRPYVGAVVRAASMEEARAKLGRGTIVKLSLSDHHAKLADERLRWHLVGRRIVMTDTPGVAVLR